VRLVCAQNRNWTTTVKSNNWLDGQTEWVVVRVGGASGWSWVVGVGRWLLGQTGAANCRYHNSTAFTAAHWRTWQRHKRIMHMAEFSSQQTKDFNDRPSDVLDITKYIVNLALSW